MRILSMVIAVTFIAGIPSTQAQNASESALQKIMPPGWECLNAPNNLVHPGLVYRRNPQTAETFSVLDLGPGVQPVTGDVAPIAINNHEQISAGVFARFLSLAGARIGGEQQYNVVIKLLDRTETDTYDDPVLQLLQQRLTPKKLKAGWNYYVVRAVQQARQMQIIVDKGIAADLGGEAQFRKLLSLGSGSIKAELQGMTGSSYVINTLRQSKPLTFCQLAQRVDAKFLMGGAGGSSLHVSLLNEYDAPNQRP